MKQEQNDLNYENLIDVFLSEFPEFRKAAEDDKYNWYIDNQLLPHIFFGNLKNYFETEIMTMGKPNLVNRLFAFFERMAVSKDEEVGGVLGASIFEYFGDDKELLKRARALMGHNTLLMSHEVEKSWGRE